MKKVILPFLIFMLTACVADSSIVPPLTETLLPPVVSTTLSTDTPVSSSTETVEPLPPLGIGSTMVSEQDGAILVFVPEGKFIMGFNEIDDANPQRLVFLDSFGSINLK